MNDETSHSLSTGADASKPVVTAEAPAAPGRAVPGDDRREADLRPPTDAGRRSAGPWRFLSLVAFVLALIALLADISILKNSRATLASAQALREETLSKLAQYTTAMVDADSRNTAVESRLSTIGTAVRDQESARAKDREQIRSDLRQFSTKIETENGLLSKAVADLQARCDTIVRQNAESRKENADARDWYMSQRGAKGGATAPAAVVVVAAVSASATGDEVRIEKQVREVVTRAESAARKDAEPTIRFPNGDVYNGEVAHGAPSGLGVLVYSNGTRYAGQFAAGKKEGLGSMTFGNGDKYSGGFTNDLRHGQGIYVYATGEKYIGDFLAGKRSGTGRYVYPNGEEYNGEFLGGKREGYGRYLYPDGTTLAGKWHDDHFAGGPQ